MVSARKFPDPSEKFFLKCGYSSFRLLYSHIFVAVFMFLLLHIFLSFAIADVARFNRMHISSVESPLEEMIDLRYLNDFTSSRRSPLINIVLLLLTMILLFSALISIP